MAVGIHGFSAHPLLGALWINSNGQASVVSYACVESRLGMVQMRGDDCVDSEAFGMSFYAFFGPLGSGGAVCLLRLHMRLLPNGRCSG